VFRIGGNTFYDRKNKIPMKIPEFKKSGIRLVTEFGGIPNRFPNLVIKKESGITDQWVLDYVMPSMQAAKWEHQRCKAR
jgi:hypothetical protein